MSLTSSFSIGLRGIQVSQMAMEVVSHNIANVNTEGYSRQRINLSTTLAYPTQVGPMGSGVDAENIQRMYDKFVTRSLLEKSSLLAKFEAQKLSMDALESVFNESQGTGINAALSEFWNGWQDVADNPEGNPERLNLLEKAMTMTGKINAMRSDMDALKSDINLRIEESVAQVNTLVREIADLNSKIVSMESGSLHQANDLRDQRDMHLKELSQFLDINYFEDPSNGSVTVVTPKGTPLVEQENYWELDARADRSGDIHLVWLRGNGGEVDITDSISNGRIGGWIELRDQVMDDFYTQFDNFTAGLIKEVNRQHSQGIGLTNFTDLTSTTSLPDYARRQTEMEGEDNDLVFTALTAGSAGDDIRVRLVKAAAPNSPLSVSTNDDPLTGIKTITVTLATNNANQIATRAEDIVDAVNNDGVAGSWVSAGLAQGEDGRGLVKEITTPLDLNRHLDNLLPFGEEIVSGTFDIVVYDSLGNPQINSITVNPTDNREDIIDQINAIDHLTATVVTDSGGDYIRIQSDSGYEYAFGNDNSSALMALGINTFFTGTNSRTIEINPMVEGNLSYLTSGRIDQNGLTQSGDNLNALDLADLKDKKFFFGSQYGTISDAYNSLAAEVGAESYAITRSHDFNATLVDQIQARRDMVSAVSLDEEMADLMKYQYAFQAAAKIISATDEMLQTLLSLK